MISSSAACVTVNVNFPESAVQKATDDYVRDLYRAKEKGNKPAPAAEPSAKPQAAFELIPSAHADEGDLFRVDTDKALSIREKLRGRLDEVLSQKRAGVVGESNDGLLVLKSPDKLKKLLLKKVEKLVSDENSDREELYGEILTANGLPRTRLKNVQKSFSRSFQAESPSGTWVQDIEGKWARKP
jgi:uncharacterized protein YdbL (DUF1318 family)